MLRHRMNDLHTLPRALNPGQKPRTETSPAATLTPLVPEKWDDSLVEALGTHLCTFSSPLLSSCYPSSRRVFLFFSWVCFWTPQTCTKTSSCPREYLSLEKLKTINKVISYRISNWVNWRSDRWAQVVPNRTTEDFHRGWGPLSHRSLHLGMWGVYLPFTRVYLPFYKEKETEARRQGKWLVQNHAETEQGQRCIMLWNSGELRTYSPLQAVRQGNESGIMAV